MPYFPIDTLDSAIPELIGNDFVFERVDYASGHQRRFWHREPMQKGETYDLRYVVRNPNPDEPEYCFGEYMAFHEPARFATYEAKFVGTTPAAVWKVERLTALAIPGEPNDATSLPLTDGAVVSAQFRDLYGGLYHGIAWAW